MPFVLVLFDDEDGNLVLDRGVEIVRDVLHAEIVLRYRIAASPAFKENALSNPWDKLSGVVGFVPGGIDHSYVLHKASVYLSQFSGPPRVGSSVGYFGQTD